MLQKQSPYNVTFKKKSKNQALFFLFLKAYQIHYYHSVFMALVFTFTTEVGIGTNSGQTFLAYGKEKKKRPTHFLEYKLTGKNVPLTRNYKCFIFCFQDGRAAGHSTQQTVI